jgi:YHS domain-containing protein
VTKGGDLVSAKQQKKKRHTDRDPSCGRPVAPGKAVKLTWEGKTYLFCSDECRRRFEADPPGDATF